MNLNRKEKPLKSAKAHGNVAGGSAPIGKKPRGQRTSHGFEARSSHAQLLQAEVVENRKAGEVLLSANAGFIELEDVTKKVYKVKHREILENVDLNTARNAFDFQLHHFGPYHLDYSRNGRYLAFGGRKGHVATYDCQRMTVVTELQLQQEVFDVQYLHNESMFAVAQERYAYIYDRDGVEIHCMQRHERPLKLQYLPYHFLLVTAGHSGHIKYHDISTGEYLIGHQTGLGPCRVMKQNPHNAVIHAGHSNGVVTMWSPSAGKSLVSMLCHRAPLTDLAVDREGHYMATVALDGMLKIWDLRRVGNHLHNFHLARPASSIDISERGVIGVGMGRQVQLLREAFLRPGDVTYLNFEINTPNPHLSSGAASIANTKALLSKVSIAEVKFRPLEDVICAGHSHGVSAFVAPGTGEPNFDSFENNPFMTAKQRREVEVQSLLNKLNPNMIALDSEFIGSVDLDRKQLQAEQQEQLHGKPSADGKIVRKKDRKRGRNKIGARLKRKQLNVIDEQAVKFQQAKKEQEKEKREQQQQGSSASSGALARFQKSSK